MRMILLIRFLVLGLVSSFTPPTATVTRSRRAGQHRANAHLWQWTRLQASSEAATDLASLTVVQLKEKLRAKGLPVSGRKAELIDRLLSSPSTSAPPVPTPSPSKPKATTPVAEAAKASPKASKAIQPKESKVKASKTTMETETEGIQQAKAKAPSKAKKSKAKAKSTTIKAAATDGSADDLKTPEDTARIAAGRKMEAAKQEAEKARAIADAKAQAEIEATLAEAAWVAAEEKAAETAAVKREEEKARVIAEAKSMSEIEAPEEKAPSGTVSTAGAQAAAPPTARTEEEEEIGLAARLAAMDDVGDRAYEILKTLGMVDDSRTIDPRSPDYDSSRDDEIADGTIYLD